MSRTRLRTINSEDLIKIHWLIKSDLYTRRKTRKKKKQNENREDYVTEWLDLDKNLTRCVRDQLDEI